MSLERAEDFAGWPSVDFKTVLLVDDIRPLEDDGALGLLSEASTSFKGEDARCTAPRD